MSGFPRTRTDPILMCDEGVPHTEHFFVVLMCVVIRSLFLAAELLAVGRNFQFP